ncbi:MAG: hypothetical protein KJ063_02560 [Anaerolineae bacterium]|nr:hypothetical protein [Anaerolineae bacterium]
MATPVKRWPNSAAWARDDAAAAMQQVITIMQPLLQHSDPIVVARAAKSMYHITNALRLLEAVGAPTRPTEA